MKVILRNKEYSTQNIVIASALSFFVVAAVTAAAAIKFSVLYKDFNYEFMFCIIIIAAISLLLMIGVQLYLATSSPILFAQTKYYAAYMCIFTLVSITSISLSAISPLLIPTAYTSLLVFVIAKYKTHPFVLNIVSALMLLLIGILEYLVSGGSVNTVIQISGEVYLWELSLMCFVSILIGGLISYFIRYKTKRTRYILVCFIFGCVTVGLIALLILINPSLHMIFEKLWLVAISVFIPFITSLIINPVVESIFNLVTDSRLIELTDSKQPLMARLIAEAPGTFNHCLAVANFAEICANAIGEDPYLARAAAYYHDVGKLDDPSFFSENQSSYNPLDELLPEVSAEIIRSHTENGYRLCEKYRIPDEIKSITTEHHGTLPIKVFYERAKQLTDGDVDLVVYSYHGRTPTTKIAAIIMICDTSEAAIRAMDQPDGDRVDKLLRNLITERVLLGQFDNCDISLKELSIIRKAIIEAFGGLYHKRVKYPGGEK